MKKFIYTLFMCSVAIASGYSDSEAKTAKTGNVQVPLANSPACDNSKFIHDGGCAGYGSAKVFLPLGAQIVAIRTYANNGGPEGDVGMHQIGDGSKGHELTWAYMYPVGQKTTPTNTVVWYDYANRSHDRVRQIALEMDWK